jgi:hypothetical protein
MYPVTVDGHEYVELTMRRCKVKDRRLAEKQGSNDAEKEIALISNLCDVPPSIIDELDAADYAVLQKELTGFFVTTTNP